MKAYQDHMDKKMNETFIEKGFIIKHDVIEPDGTRYYVLSMSSKLVIKSAIELCLLVKEGPKTEESGKNDKSAKKKELFTLQERLKLVKEGVRVVSQIDFLQSIDCWVVNDANFLNGLKAENDQSKKLSMINEYYGSKIATYFGWLQFYTRSLMVPVPVGLLLFAHQLYTGSIDSPLLPVFGMVIAIWSTLFTEMWKRSNAVLGHTWDVLEVEEDETTKDLAKV